MRFIGILAVATLSAWAMPVADNVAADVNGAVNAAADILAKAEASVANVAVKNSNIGDNIGNNNHVNVLPRDLITVGALIEALANALANADVSLKAVLANVQVQDSSILTNILNDNKITVLRRDGIILPANIDAIVLTFINAAVAAGADVQAAVANIGIDYSTLLSNIGNNNVVFVRRGLPEIVDIAALVNAIANACAKVGVDAKALIGNISIENSSVLTDILNGNKVIVARDGVILPANIDAIVSALINALVAAGVDVQAAVANIGIDYSTLLSNIGNNNVIFIRSLPEIVDIAALLKALADACAKVGVDIKAVIANLNIDNSSVLTDILNGNKVIVGKRDLGLPLITADVLAVLKAIVEACLDAQIDVFATALNAGLNCATILSNILNNNSVTILPIFLRRAAALDVYSTVLALVQALIGVGVPVDVFALNAFIKNSNIATNILNDNIIKILAI